MKKNFMVFGGERNCDYRGGSDTPMLGIFYGEREHVEMYASTLDGWVAWGTGRLEEIAIVPILESDVLELIKDREEKENRKKELISEKEKIENRLRQIKEELK